MRSIYFLIIIVCIPACNFSRIAAREKILFVNNNIVAHRGAWKENNLPKNSVAALKQAIKMGYKGSEFDVRMTADDSLVINHDPIYNNLEIEKTDFADLEAFKLSNGEKLPTLREYILAGIANNKTTKLVCEIKPSDISKERSLDIALKVIQLVRELKAQEMLVYISFDYDILKKIIETDPKATTQYLGGNKSPEQLKEDGISGADYHFSVFQNHPEWIKSAKENNIELNAWTVDDSLVMDWLLANNFDFITTNEPELLQERINQSPVSKGWKLIWSDEFNYHGLPDSTKWKFNVGGHGWGNNELEYYTDSDTLNAVVNKGVLKITARKQIMGNRNYTSARLTTKGKIDFMYGRIEVRAELPEGRGTWPAIWMLGANINEVKWPACGEIDIMEHVGYNKDSIFGTIHTAAYNHNKGTQKGKSVFISDPYNSFHIFAIEWTPEKIDFMLDDKVYYQFANEHLSAKEWPFDQPFYLIINLAIGGGWGGKMGIDETIFPTTMKVDYVRVFQK